MPFELSTIWLVWWIISELFFFTVGKLVKLNLDGSYYSLLYQNPEGYIRKVALDYGGQKVYWLEGDHDIRYVSLTDSKVQSFEFKNHTDHYFYDDFSIDEDHVYFVTALTNSSDYHLRRAKKSSGVSDENFDVKIHGDQLYVNYIYVLDN